MSKVKVELVGGPSDGEVVEVPATRLKIIDVRHGKQAKYYRSTPWSLKATWKHQKERV